MRIAALEVMNEGEVKALRWRHNLGGDAISDNLTTRAAACGVEAYWNVHTYHQTTLSIAGDKANQIGLHGACFSLGKKAAPGKAAALIEEFLDRLIPANEQGKAALIYAYARFVGTWHEEAA